MRITSAFLPLAVVVVALSSSTVSSKAPADAAVDTVGSAQNSTVDIIASLKGSATQFTDEDGNPIRYIESGGNPLGDDDDDDDEEDEPAQRRGAPKKGKGRKKGKKVFKSKRAKLSKHQKAAKISSLISTTPPPSHMVCILPSELHPRRAAADHLFFSCLFHSSSIITSRRLGMLVMIS